MVSRCGTSQDVTVEKITPADRALTKAADLGSNVVQTIKDIATAPPQQVGFQSTSFEAEGDVVNEVVIGKQPYSDQPVSRDGLVDIQELITTPPFTKSPAVPINNGNAIDRIVNFLEDPSVQAPQTFILTGLEFQSGSIELTDSSLQIVDTLASVIAAYETMRVRLDGHTDNVGQQEKNKQLSADRAQSVMDALIKAGASPDRLTARGFGMERPIADNKTKQGQRANRRVEVIVLEK